MQTEPVTWEEWVLHAACRAVNPEIFYVRRTRDMAPAKTVCLSCPVRFDCLTHALVNDERFGIWGGLSGRERRALLKKRRRRTDVRSVRTT